MSACTPVTATLGGALIGLAASAMLLFDGRIAGVSGLLGRAIVRTDGGARVLRLSFVGGLLAGGLALALVAPAAFDAAPSGSTPALLVAGLLVGLGTRLGNGCTSGHGVCGVARLSPRSLAATCAFMAAAAVTVFVARHVVGGSQ
jgi:hypothetical protein